jgi:probable HAF family extracellular repeat protein
MLAVAVLLPTATAYPRRHIAVAASPRWQLTDLGTLGGAFSRATAINDRGQVVGYGIPAGARTATHCFVWAHGSMRDLGALPGSRDCQPTGIDAAGDIAGVSGGEAFWWRNGRFTDLGPTDPIPPEADEVVAINSHGLVVVAKPGGAFIWHDGHRTPLELPHGPDPYIDGFAISDNGEIVGSVQRDIGSNRDHAVRWDHDGTLHYLPELPDATGSTAWAVNAAGVIAGDNNLGTGYLTRAVVWKNGTVTKIVTPHRGTGRAVSGTGEVGVEDDWGTGLNTGSQAFVWSNGKLLPAWNDYLDFTCANAHLLAGQGYRGFVWMNDKLTWLPGRRSGVTDVNAHDQVVGWTMFKGPAIAGNKPVHAALWSR